MDVIPLKARTIRINLTLARLYRITGCERAAIASYKECLRLFYVLLLNVNTFRYSIPSWDSVRLHYFMFFLDWVCLAFIEDATWLLPVSLSNDSSNKLLTISIYLYVNLTYMDRHNVYFGRLMRIRSLDKLTFWFLWPEPYCTILR